MAKYFPFISGKSWKSRPDRSDSKMFMTPVTFSSSPGVSLLVSASTCGQFVWATGGQNLQMRLAACISVVDFSLGYLTIATVSAWLTWMFRYQIMISCPLTQTIVLYILFGSYWFHTAIFNTVPMFLSPCLWLYPFGLKSKIISNN